MTLFFDVIFTLFFLAAGLAATYIHHRTWVYLKNAKIRPPRKRNYWMGHTLGAVFAVLLVVIALKLGLVASAITYVVFLIPHYAYVLLQLQNMAPADKPVLMA